MNTNTSYSCKWAAGTRIRLFSERLQRSLLLLQVTDLTQLQDGQNKVIESLLVLVIAMAIRHPTVLASQQLGLQARTRCYLETNKPYFWLSKDKTRWGGEDGWGGGGGQAGWAEGGGHQEVTRVA